jgi:hypothetical protein
MIELYDAECTMKSNGQNRQMVGTSNDVAYVAPFKSIMGAMGIDPTMVPDEILSAANISIR